MTQLRDRLADSFEKDCHYPVEGINPKDGFKAGWDSCEENRVKPLKEALEFYADPSSFQEAPYEATSLEDCARYMYTSRYLVPTRIAREALAKLKETE